MNKVKPYTTILCRDNAYWKARISKNLYMKISDNDPRPDESGILQDLQAEDL